MTVYENEIEMQNGDAPCGRPRKIRIPMLLSLAAGTPLGLPQQQQARFLARCVFSAEPPGRRSFVQSVSSFLFIFATGF
jgi:hypothetical protein